MFLVSNGIKRITLLYYRNPAEEMINNVKLNKPQVLSKDSQSLTNTRAFKKLKRVKESKGQKV